MGEELKECPFCGEKASIQDCSYFGSTPMWSAMCDNPKCFAYTEAFKTKKEAVECWNNRSAEDVLQKWIAEQEQERNELEAERDRLREALERVVKLLDRPMLKDDMCLYMDKAIRVARVVLKGMKNEKENKAAEV